MWTRGAPSSLPPDGPACLLPAPEPTCPCHSPSFCMSGDQSVGTATFPARGSYRTRGSASCPRSLSPCSLTVRLRAQVGPLPASENSRLPAGLRWVRRLGLASVCLSLSHGVYDSWEWLGKVAGFGPTEHRGELVNKAGGIVHTCRAPGEDTRQREPAGGGGLPGVCGRTRRWLGGGRRM